MCIRQRNGVFAVAMAIFIAVCSLSCSVQRKETWNRATEAERERQENCPPTREYFEVKTSLDLTNFSPPKLNEKLTEFAGKLGTPDTVIRLGPEVVVDFSAFNLEQHGLYLGRCVTLTSVYAFPEANNATNIDGDSLAAATEDTPNSASNVKEGRTPWSRGPLIKFGKHRGSHSNFLHIACNSGNLNGDYARVSGIRLFGPDEGNQTVSDTGIYINRCIGIEISNMEIAGWGGAGIYIVDEGPDQGLNGNLPNFGRIMNPEQVKIHDSFFHHNQYPHTTKCDYVWEYYPPPGRLVPKNCVSEALGYGVEVNAGAWAHIYRNVFDFNRHSIAASGDSGGYLAEQNLVLKGGGYHGGIGNTYTHSFDVHGSDCIANSCGDAGSQFWYVANAFQFRKDHAIKIRGKPRISTYISENVFPHPGLEDDDGDDAIYLQTGDDSVIGPSNISSFDSFGRYEVCDFDGNGIDDLFLATGANWWFSSHGEFPWAYLNAKTETLDQVRLGYFDGDGRCDILKEGDGQWLISSGGVGEWQSFVNFTVPPPPLSEVRFGRFDPSIQDPRPGRVTRRTTHAFRRSDDTQWWVMRLANSEEWQPVGSSGFELEELKFGDFTGDGVTDVLAVEGGRWSISESAINEWRDLPGSPSDDVTNLFVANMDYDDNIDDVLKLERQVAQVGTVGNWPKYRVRVTWLRSKNGTDSWKMWKEYTFRYVDSPDVVHPPLGFVGRFGAAPGGSTLVIDQNRRGHFHGEFEVIAGASPDWPSLFAY